MREERKNSDEVEMEEEERQEIFSGDIYSAVYSPGLKISLHTLFL